MKTMTGNGSGILGEFIALSVDEVARIEVGPGCHRRDLPSIAGVRAWIVEMAPGSEWPHVDEHPGGEGVYVVDGEMIEGDRRFPSGSYLHFAPGSSHRPYTEHGVRLIGWNPQATEAGERTNPLSPRPTASPESHRRALFDFEIDFSNGGGLNGRDFRLDIDGDVIDDETLAGLLVGDLRLLMVGDVRILNKRIVAEPHKRPG